MSTQIVRFPPVVTSFSVTATNPSVGTDGATAPTSATEVGFVDGSGNLQAWKGTSQATGPNVVVTATALPANAAQETGGNLATIVTNTANLSTIATNTSNTQGTVAPGTAATKADLVAGVYNSAGVTLTTGQQAALQLDAAGALKISSTTAISTTDLANGPVTPGTAATKSELSGYQYNSSLPTATTGQQVAAQCDSNGRALVASIANQTVKAASTAAVAADPALVVALSPNNNTLANALFIKNTDGTNTAAVKAASTAPVATDPALVVALSPNTPAVKTASPVNTNGSLTNNVAIGVTNVALTAPTNAVGFILEADSTNTVNVRWAIVTVPTSTSGMLMEPGRDTGFIPCAATVNVIGTAAGPSSVNIQWVMSS